MSRAKKLHQLRQIFKRSLYIGLAAVLFKSCTFPDAVYANMQIMPESENIFSYSGTVSLKQEELEYPEELMEHDGELYQLVSTEVKEKTVEGTLAYISAIVPYELEGDQEPPEKTVVTLKDERTGSQYSRELSCLEVTEKDVFWQDTFEFPIIVSDYDADTFLLGNIEIPKTAELTEYREELLKSLDLSEYFYQIDSVEWNGESYVEDGTIFRNAIAKGEKRIRRVDAKYGGTIRTPDYVGYQYVSTYKKLKKEGENEDENENVDINAELTEPGKAEIDLPEADKSFLGKLLDYIQEHVTIVTISSLFLIMVLGCICLMFASKKERNR